MQRTDTKSEDQIKIKTLCEYLFFDQFQETATFPRFEQCFQPLFNNVTISMETVFKDICGEKKKYINYTFSTVKSCKKRECVTLVEILSDKSGKIHGINLEYDGVFKSKMYPSRIDDELVVSLEMTLGIVDEKPIKEKKVGKLLGIKQGNYRDGVTHIFGTMNQETGLITFLGFKCISGKTVFVGFPEGEGFLFGKFGCKFHDLKLQMTVDGITKLEPGFKKNPRTNFYLEGISGKLLNQNLNKEEVIKDEAQLANLKDDLAIEKLITTPIVEDNHFFNEKLKDEISGNDYKEVVNQHPRNWILRAGGKRQRTGRRKIQTLEDALKGFNEEHENRAPSKLRARKLRSAPKTDSGEMLGSGRRVGGKMGRGMNQGPMGGLKGPKVLGQKGGSNMQEAEPGIAPPWLHKTKAFVPPQRYGMTNKRVGNVGKIIGKPTKLLRNRKIVKQTPPRIFLNKQNYLGLKERLGKLIHDEVSQKSEGNDEIKQIILSQIIPDPGIDSGRLRGI